MKWKDTGLTSLPVCRAPASLTMVCQLDLLVVLVQ
jgi:hypothetical protein